MHDHLNEIFSSMCVASGGFSIVESEIHDHEVFRVQLNVLGAILRAKL